MHLKVCGSRRGRHGWQWPAEQCGVADVGLVGGNVGAALCISMKIICRLSSQREENQDAVEVSRTGAIGLIDKFHEPPEPAGNARAYHAALILVARAP